MCSRRPPAGGTGRAPAEPKGETERNHRAAPSMGVIKGLKLNNTLGVQANGEQKAE